MSNKALARRTKRAKKSLDRYSGVRDPRLEDTSQDWWSWGDGRPDGKGDGRCRYGMGHSEGSRCKLSSWPSGTSDNGDDIR